MIRVSLAVREALIKSDFLKGTALRDCVATATVIFQWNKSCVIVAVTAATRRDDVSRGREAPVKWEIGLSRSAAARLRHSLLRQSANAAESMRLQPLRELL